MAAMREADLLALAKRGFAGMGGALLYGTDEESIANVAREIQASWGGGDVSLVEASSLRGPQGTLLDLISAPSLFGGRGLIVIQGVEDQHGPLVAPVFGVADGNAYLLVAGSLRKGSALRGAAEGARACAVLAFHEESAAAQLLRIQRNGEAMGLLFEPGAAERLLELCGGNRALIAAELEKLSLLRPPSGKVSAGSVEELCGDLGEADFNALFQSLLEGDVAGTDKSVSAALESGELPAALPMLQSYLIRLAAVKAAVEEGASWETAFQKARPPIYFGQQAQVRRQLSALTLESLLRLQEHVQHIVFQARGSGGNGDLVAARALLSQAVRLSGRGSASHV